MADNDTLRHRAEALARENAAQSPENLAARSPEEIGQTLHELRVHQIELELQNEELRRTQAELAAARARYFDLYDLAPVGYLAVSKQGLILEANLTAATLLGVARNALVKWPIFTRFIFKEDQDLYYRHRKQLFEMGDPQSCELRMIKQDGTAFWAQLAATATQFADGAPVLRVVLNDITERKRAEEALRASESRYRSILNASPDAIAITDIEGRILMVSPGAVTMFSRDRAEELLGRLVTDFIVPEDRDRAQSNIRLMHQGIFTGPGEYRAIRPAGNLFDIEANSEFIRGADDQPTGMVFIIRDITARKQAEDKLRANRRQLTDIIEFLPDATLAIDRDKRVIIWNKAIEDMTGVPAAEMIGHGDYAYTIPFYGEARPQLMDLVLEDQAAIAARYPTITREGDTLTAEVFCNALYHHQGAWVLAKASPLHDQFGNMVGAIESIRDITARKRAESQREAALEALRESEDKFRSTIQQASDGILISDEQGKIAEWNKGMELIFGLPRERMLGTALWDFQYRTLPHELQNEAVYQGLHHTIVNGMPTEYAAWMNRPNEMQMLTANGETKIVLVTAFPIRTQHGTLYASVTRDITDRKQLEQALTAERDSLEQRVIDRTQALAAANERLQELDRLKSKFVSDVSHELRTPVTSLMLYLSLLEHGKPEKQAHYLSSATQQAGRMKQLIEDILDLSRLERDKADLTLSPVDLNAVLEQACVAQQPRAEMAGLALTFEPAAALPLVRGDIDRLLQVVTNLLANAINYTSTGEVRIRSFQQADRVGFEVQDTGLGIDPEDLPHLFERFYRGRRASQSSVRGTGLGLNIVKEIVDWHGGTLEVQSEVGAGSTFTVWLPPALALTDLG